MGPLRIRRTQHRLAWQTRRHLPCQHAAATFSHICLGHSNSTKWRIGVERIGRYAIADPPVFVIEQIASDDFVVVPGGVSEGSSTVTIAECPDARNVGASSSSTVM